MDWSWLWDLAKSWGPSIGKWALGALSEREKAAGFHAPTGPTLGKWGMYGPGAQNLLSEWLGRMKEPVPIDYETIAMSKALAGMPPTEDVTMGRLSDFVGEKFAGLDDVVARATIQKYMEGVDPRMMGTTGLVGENLLKRALGPALAEIEGKKRMMQATMATEAPKLQLQSYLNRIQAMKAAQEAGQWPSRVELLSRQVAAPYFTKGMDVFRQQATPLGGTPQYQEPAGSSWWGSILSGLGGVDWSGIWDNLLGGGGTEYNYPWTSEPTGSEFDYWTGGAPT